MFNAYFLLTKPSILFLVLITTALGFYVAERDFNHLNLLFWTLLGSAMTCAGSGALNHFMERDSDALMDRTKRRPIPSGQVSPRAALIFGLVLTILGTVLLIIFVNPLTAFLSLLTSLLYLLVYTPLKKISWLNTTIGAIPGAIPPMGGWAAVHNNIGLEAWVLFLILFAWQHPHFFAIAWMYKDDYAKAGYRMLPCVYPDGYLTFIGSMMFSSLLMAVSMVPTMIGMSGKIYLCGAMILGAWILWLSWVLFRTHTVTDARHLLKATVFYLPLLLGLFVIDGFLRY